MAFVLVKWTTDERTSVIPSTWVIKPSPLPEALPVEGECYWKKKSCRYEATLLAISGKIS